jgi:hypothetical protein
MSVQFENDEFGKTYEDPEKVAYESKKGKIASFFIGLGLSKNRSQAELIMIILVIIFFLIGVIIIRI